MTQTITIKPTITVEVPADQVLISRAEYDQLTELADRSGWWTNSKSRFSDKEVPQWVYSERGVQAIKSSISKQGTEEPA